VAEKYIGDLLKTEWWDYAPWQLQGVDFNVIPRAIDQILEMRDRSIPVHIPTVVRLSELVESL